MSAQGPLQSDAGFRYEGSELDLFADAAISDHIFFLSNVRMVQDQIVHVDLFSVKFTDLSPADFNIEAGEIDLPFGNLGERRFPRTNPFYTLPLLHEHLTSLRSSNYGLFTYDSRYTSAGVIEKNVPTIAKNDRPIIVLRICRPVSRSFSAAFSCVGSSRQ